MSKILLTGANRGLGALVADRIFPEVTELYVTARHPETLPEKYHRLALDLANPDFNTLWQPFSHLPTLDAVIHIASPYITSDLTQATADEIDIITTCAANDVKFLSNIANKLNPECGRLIVIGAILAIPGYRAKGLISWYKSSIDAIAEILSHELPDGIKVVNFNLGTFREDSALVASGDALASDDVAQQIIKAAMGELDIDGYELLMKAPNDDKILENMIK